MNHIIQLFQNLSAEWRFDIRTNTFSAPIDYVEALFPGSLAFIRDYNSTALPEEITRMIARERLSFWFLHIGGGPTVKMDASDVTASIEQINAWFFDLIADASCWLLGGPKDKMHDYAEEGFIILFGTGLVAALYIRADT